MTETLQFVIVTGLSGAGKSGTLTFSIHPGGSPRSRTRAARAAAKTAAGSKFADPRRAREMATAGIPRIVASMAAATVPE